jgi:hypothetical protein
LLQIKRAFFVISVILGLFQVEDSFSAAWVVPYGKTQIYKTYTTYTAEFVNVTTVKNGSTVITSSEKERFIKIEYKPLVEVGVTEDITIGFSPSLQHITKINSNGFGFNWGLVEADFLLRKEIWSDGFTTFSVQPLIKMFGAYDEGDSPSLGQKQVDVELRGLVGRGFKYDNRWHYLNVEAAYRKRMENPGDEFRFDTTLGYELFPSFTIAPQVTGILSVNDTNSSDRIVSNSTDFDLVKMQLSFIRKFSPKLSVQVGLYSHVYARNTGGGGGMLVSYWSSF